MKNINKIILTSLITAGSLGIFGKGSGQSLEGQFHVTDEKYPGFIKEIEKTTNNAFPYSSEKIYSENLRINLNDNIYHVTKKNEEQGVEDLRKICFGGYEEAWFYFPENQTWYEVGINSDSNSVEPFLPLIGKVLEENKNAGELIFYHNHPGEGFDKPSINDIAMLVRFNRMFPERKIAGKIITKEDITEYSLNSKRKEEILNKVDWQGYLWYPEKYHELFEYFDIKCAPL
ncbi:MAG: hypothetical protein Q8O84_01310 [Nanoarchaeota archaeon]|nr:hypothetical protein [Nanoarchaeota archaeon]